MLIQKNRLGLLLIFAILGLGFVCESGQTDEANKLVDEANVLITKNQELGAKAGKIFDELLGDGITKVRDLGKYKTDNRSRFDEVINLTKELEKNNTEAAGKFEEVAALRVDEKFKEYTSLKGKELRKRAAASKASLDLVNAFLDAKDFDTVNGLITDYNDEATEMVKEADELARTADQAIKDNPGVFKKN
jgi:hypothetical protein